MPAPRRRLPHELFETRSHSWQEVGLSHELLPDYGSWVRAATAVILVIVGSAGSHWLVRWTSPRLFRRVDSATAGTLGFLIRLTGMALVVILALRIAGIVLQSTRPFRVGERVRLVGGALAGSLEGTVSSLGLFYTTLVQGADHLQVPNSVLLSLVVVPLREPDKVDFRARFSHEASPRGIEEQLLKAIKVPTRYAPHVALEEVDRDGVVLRINATPLRPDDGSQLAEEVLGALQRETMAQAVA